MTNTSNSSSQSKSNIPPDRPIFQQRMKAWKPLFTFKDAAIFFSLCGVVFIALGIFLLVESNANWELIEEYTECFEQGSTSATKKCSSKITSKDTATKREVCKCRIDFEIQRDVELPVYLFYGLTNFYQNHRFYKRSRDPDQLLGKANPVVSKTGQAAIFNVGCQAPYLGVNSTAYAPCGAVANSLFNDEFRVYYDDQSRLRPSANSPEIILDSTNLALDWERKSLYGTVNWKTAAKTLKPSRWDKTAAQRSATSYAGDDALIVWMRSAPLPSFRKLYARVNVENGGDLFKPAATPAVPPTTTTTTTTTTKKHLPKGFYHVDISYSFPVSEFGGRKFFVLATTNWMGGRNPVLGILYLTTGCVELVIGLVYVFAIMKKRNTSQQSVLPIY